ncbi:MAG: hypothetical protein RLZZ499_2848 [Cyanobacteriota bacterium]
MIPISKEKTLWYCLKQLLRSPLESPEYQAWKQKLFRDRLRICFWVVLLCVTAFAVKDFSLVYDPEFSQSVIENYGREEIELYRNQVIYSYLTISIVWLIIWYRLKRDNFQHYSWAIFFGFSWSLTLFPLVIGTFLGEPYLGEVSNWGLIFLSQGILIPVYWRLHLLAQLGLIIYYVGIIPLLGLVNLIETETISCIFTIETLIPLFSACFISITAVFMYERLQQKEFKTRRELKVFLHSVTHDLHTPMLASSIVLENLLKQPGKQLTLDRLVLEKLYQGSDRQINLVNSLVEAHHTEVNGIAIAPQSCQITDLVNAILVDLQPILLEHQVVVDNRLTDDLPTIQADPTQLWRVFNNLLTNALKHNPNYIRIIIEATLKSDYLKLTISDNGVGISTAQTQNLFKLYSRGKRARYMPGLGLGLYLSQQIITAHGGEIGVISSPKTGSTFWFTLPV